MMSVVRAIAVTLFLGLLFTAPANAHPHVWADIKVRILFDDQGRVSGLHQTWLFDDFYSAFVLSDADMSGDKAPDQKALDAVLAENLSNLEEYAYFTRVLSGETRIATGRATGGATRVIGNRFEMSFELPLSAPLAVGDLPFRYAVFDPTYYIEMVHAEVPDAVTLVHPPKGCVTKLVQPKPDTEQVLLAASLDKTQSAGDGLGQYFAEEVTLTCG